MISFTSVPDFEKFVEIFTGLYRATFGYSFGFGLCTLPVSIFLVHIPNSQNWVLVDAADPGSPQKLLSAISAHFASFPNHNLKYVVITHCHFDHTGAIPRLLEEYKDLKVILGQPELPFIADGVQYSELSGDTYIYQAYKHFANPTKVIVSRDKILALEEGKENEFEFFETLEPICTFGHTPGSMSYLHRPSNSILIGDCMMNLPSFPSFSPSIQLAPPITTHNMKKAKESIKKIAELEGVNYVFLSHDQSEKGLDVESVRSFAKSLKP
ncbi:12520_t:CDS:2 [Acaulospora morrowiae]|uniref:12520_t:CDS:1 n=1 Tax=Acaulospora morrowiae TaxID=94023 RepID=A0A9N8VIS9_9GLOM|nr:12520_t:CDS:2 [Acaulospora morrowiae]